MSLLLIYQIENEVKQERLLEVAQELEFEVREVSLGETHEKVGALVGLEGFKKTGEIGDLDRAPSHEMILFANTDHSKIQEFISRLREDNFFFPHKAALTQTTKDWTFRMLVNHIEKENKVVRAYARLMKDIAKAEVYQEKINNDSLQAIIEEAKALKDLGEDLSERNIKLVQAKLDNFIRELA